MPFAVVALVLGALTLGGFAAGGGPNAETLSALAHLKPDSFETLAVGLVLCALLVLLLVPGALVRLLYGRRPVSRSEAPSLGLAEGSSVGGARGGFDAGFRKSEEV